jgi:hypothetical protein
MFSRNENVICHGFYLKKNQNVRLFWQNVAFVVFWIFFWSFLRKIGFLEKSNASKIFLR